MPLKKRTKKTKYSKLIKNKKGNKNKQKRKKLIIAFLFIFIVLGASAYFLTKFASGCDGDNCNPFLSGIANTIQPKLKQTNGLTNILVYGLDTRDDNPGLMNTDTIILVTINHNDKNVVMTSIPRDLTVTFELPNGNSATSKINGAYANGEWQKKGSGTATLKKTVNMVLGLPIHYHVQMTLQGFVDIVDRIGGVDINIPEDYKDAYPKSELPRELQDTCNHYYHDGEFCLFEFKAGDQHLDGQHALIYARSRLLSPRGDYDRARRQQKVIDAVKEKILSSDTYSDPKKLWDLFNIVNKNIKTSKFTINDVRALLALKDQFDTDKIGHVVLDPMYGNSNGKYIYVPPYDPGQGYRIVARDQTYQEIQDYHKQILKHPLIYNEAPIISIYNASGQSTLQKDWAAELAEDNPIIIVRDGNKIISLAKPPKKIKIYRFTEDKKEATEEYLKNFFKVDKVRKPPTDGTIQAYGGEHYVVVIGK